MSESVSMHHIQPIEYLIRNMLCLVLWKWRVLMKICEKVASLEVFHGYEELARAVILAERFDETSFILNQLVCLL